MSIEPVCHSSLVFSGGVFVAEYVWDLTSFAVVGTDMWALSELWGSPWNAEGVSEESVFIGDRVGGSCKVCTQ